MIAVLQVILIMSANAREITVDEARAVAMEFFGVDRQSNNAKVLRSISKNVQVGPVPYYIFNVPERQGFVIISGDDRAKKILGYSDKGSFDIDNMPPQLAALLEQFASQLQALPESMPQDPSWTSNAAAASDGVLLQTAEWGQGYPYNTQCPVIYGETSLTGCVATAMAIVMNYKNWPDRYDWNEIPETAISEPSSELARLMADAGEAVYMDYSPYESGANMNWVGHKLQQDFNYSPECQYITRQNFSNEKWDEMLRDNLNADCPVIYNGSGTGNHAFVIDGYKGADYHVNWGWDGAYNGYYSLDALNPGHSDFSDSGGMVINITPDKSGKEYSTCFVDYGYFWATAGMTSGIKLNCDKIVQNEPFNLVADVVTCLAGFVGDIGVALVDNDDNIKEVINTLSYTTWNDNEHDYVLCGITLELANNIITVPIEPTDRLQVVSKEQGADKWLLVLGTIESSSYVNILEAKSNNSTINIDIKTPDVSVYLRNMDEYYPQCEYPSTTLHLIKGSSTSIGVGAPENGDKDSFVVMNIKGRSCYGDDFTFSDPSWVSTAFAIYSDTYTITIDYVKADKEASITLDTPGTIETELSKEDALTVAGLTINGNINATDLWYIRDNCPCIKRLDISNAKIHYCDIQDTKYTGFSELKHLEDFMPSHSFDGLSNLRDLKLPQNLVGIENLGLANAGIVSLDLPKTVNEIHINAFFQCENLETVICRNPNPIGILDCAFSSTKCPEYGTLYVPVGTKKYYEVAEVWREFSQIIEDESLGSYESFDITLNNNDIQMRYGEEYQLTATGLSENTKVIWTSTNPKVAEVDQTGMVTAMGDGQATIIAAVEGFDYAKTSCNVTVIVPAGMPYIDVYVDPNNSTKTIMNGKERSKIYVDKGDNVDIRFEPAPLFSMLFASYYNTEDWSGSDITSEATCKTYTIYDVQKDYNVQCRLAIQQDGVWYTPEVEYEAEGNDTIYTYNTSQVASGLGYSGDVVIPEKVVFNHPKVKNGDVTIQHLTGWTFDDYQCENLHSINLPKTINYLTDGDLMNSYYQYLIVNWEEPYDVGLNVFYNPWDENDSPDKLFNRVTLMVPEGTLSKYKSHAVWGRFARIIEGDDWRLYEQEFPIGDTNFDEKVSVTDYVNVASHIIQTDESGRFNQTQADINADGVIDVADYVHVANIILFDSPNGPSYLSRNLDSDNQWSDAMMVVGKDRQNSITVSVNNVGDFSAFQFDMALPDGLAVEDVSKAFTSIGHQITWAHQGNNKYRFLCGSMDNSIISDKKLLNINLSIAENFDDGELKMDNIRLVQNNGTIHVLGDVQLMFSQAVSIIENVNINYDNDGVYDLQGRKVANNRKDAEKLPAGVYISNHQSFIVK